MSERSNISPSGTINVYNKKGYIKLPSEVMKDLNLLDSEGSLRGKDLPYVSHFNCVLLISPSADTEEIISGLDILKEILRHRTGVNLR